jgi:hypothetical protein
VKARAAAEQREHQRDALRAAQAVEAAERARRDNLIATFDPLAETNNSRSSNNIANAGAYTSTVGGRAAEYVLDESNFGIIDYPSMSSANRLYNDVHNDQRTTVPNVDRSLKPTGAQQSSPGLCCGAVYY